MPVRNRKARRLDDRRANAKAGAHAKQGACILRNVRLEQRQAKARNRGGEHWRSEGRALWFCLANCFNVTTLQNKNVRKNEKCARRDWRMEFFVGALTTQQKLKRSASARESSKCAKHYGPDESEGGIQRKHIELEGNGHEDASWLDTVADHAIRIY